MKKSTYRFTAQKAPRLAKNFFAGRRSEFRKKMPANSVAIIVTNPERTRSNDTEYAYRPSSDVLYLSNFPEPEAILVFTKFKGDNRFLMFVRPKDKMREIWTGIRFGTDGAKNEFGADEAHTIDEFEKVVGPLIDQADQVLYRLGRNEHVDARFNKIWSATQKPLGNPEEIVHELRLFKSADELAIMRHAGAISAQAHVEAMRLSRPGLYEYQLQASMEAVFRFNGAAYPAYTSIVGGGNNANILHYIENNAELQDGDLVLIDAACEYHGYASDITRTFPVNGKFSKAQREIYEVVLASQLAAINMTKPGVRLIDVHETASNVLRQGLVRLGILPRTHLTAEGEQKAIAAWKKKNAKAPAGAKSSKKAAAEPLRLFDFFMHGTSHWIGMDVHDVGTYGTRSQKGKKRLLKPGMVFTVEPGLYISRDETRVPAKYRGIGIRIEDDVAVTAKGFEVLTAGVPKEVDEIEATMAAGRAHCEHVEAVFAGTSFR
ncbi:MAG: aminopeptidase P N-terminal domain-containing protein [Cyanobacteria bacterium SZAS LIN-3]|nr:aminopeptidase P N-terminal domain-containing protein [Cyanobacteria bacterium SZAS LIN-3]